MLRLRSTDFSPSAPIEDYLQDLYNRYRELSGGKVADYIPELSKADPNDFGIAIATVDGEVYSVGDANKSFTIQSVSKPFMYGYGLEHYGRETVLKHVGVEPTGEAFNSIVLDEVANRPFNPMVNAGAIAVAELMRGEFGGAAHREHAGAVFQPRRAEARHRRGRVQIGTGYRPPQPRHRLYDAQYRHADARSAGRAGSLFPAMLGQRHLPRSRDHGGDTCQ